MWPEEKSATASKRCAGVPCTDRVSLIITVTANSQETQSCAYVKLEYTELRRIAAGYLKRDRPGVTLQPTALVHEVFLRLVQSGDLNFTDSTHFLAVAARSMRQILVDRARTNNAAKRNIVAAPPSQWDSLFMPDNR